MRDTNEGDEEEQQEHDDESCSSKQTSTTTTETSRPRQGGEEEEITNEDNEEEQGSGANLVVVGRRRRSRCTIFTTLLAVFGLLLGWLFGWATGVMVFIKFPNSGLLSWFVGITISVSLTAGSYTFLARERPDILRDMLCRFRSDLIEFAYIVSGGITALFNLSLVGAFMFLAFYLSDATSGWATLVLLCLQVYVSLFLSKFGMERVNDPPEYSGVRYLARRFIDWSACILGYFGGAFGSFGLYFWVALGLSPLPWWIAWMVPLAILTALFWSTSKVSAWMKQRQSTASQSVAYELAANSASMKQGVAFDASGKTTGDFDDDGTEAESTTSSDIV